MATVSGDCDPWPSKRDLIKLLDTSGFPIRKGPFSVTLAACQHVQIKGLAVSIQRPFFSGEAAYAELVHEAALLSAALTAADVRHHLVVRDEGGLADYLHHRWPK